VLATAVLYNEAVGGISPCSVPPALRNRSAAVGDFELGWFESEFVCDFSAASNARDAAIGVPVA